MFASRAVLVTGGAKGIGKAIVSAFLKGGATVHSVDIERNRDVTHARLHNHICDVGDRDAVRRVANDAREISGSALNILVNNVAIQTDNGTPAHLFDEEAWDRHLAINLTSYFLFSKYLIPGILLSSAGGAIVNIASVQGLQSQRGIPAYAASKGGVLSLTRQLALEYAASGIRVNAVNPGTIDTPLLRQNLSDVGSSLEAAAQPYPMKRIGTPEEVAEVVLFLASDKASFITGEYINVCGGIMAQGGWANVS